MLVPSTRPTRAVSLPTLVSLARLFAVFILGGGRGGGEFTLKLVFSVAFVLLGGVFSGLSLGLMGLDQTNLQVLALSGPPAAQRDARRVLALLAHGRHFVLCTLLLSNVVVNETLPVFLDSLTGGGGLLAVIISSALIVIFGEVLPQALCAQHGLRIGARCVPFVRLLMLLESPVCYPTARILDAFLGTAHGATLYRRPELLTLVSLHSSPSRASPGAHSAADGGYAALEPGALSEAEVGLVGAVFGLAERTAGEKCVRREGVVCIENGLRVGEVDLRKLLLTRQAYVPVTRSSTWLRTSEKGEAWNGYLKVEQIVHALARPNDLIRSLPLSPLVQVEPATPLTECYAYLKDNPEALLVVCATTSSTSTDGMSDGELTPQPQSDLSSSSSSTAIGFLSLSDIGNVLLRSSLSARTASFRSAAARAELLAVPSQASVPSTPDVVAHEAARASLTSRRRASTSLGLNKLVQDLVDRQLSHSPRSRSGSGSRTGTHRASSSQLSFRLSSSSSSSDTDDPLAHSHHRSSASLSLSHSYAATPLSSPGRSVGGSPKPPPQQREQQMREPGLGGAFRFPFAAAAVSAAAATGGTVFEEAEAFALGGLDSDGETDAGRQRPGGDDSGFGEEGLRVIEYGGVGGEKDPLGAAGG
ncbi:hypothetical protein JCM10207_007855 [Rhodosporidiobolus poonsookiae]